MFGDFLNVFNNGAYENVIDRRQVSTNFGVPSRFVLPRRLMLGAKFRFYAGLGSRGSRSRD